ncbi:MAG: hypothetical protein J5775_03870 [Spirochaetales bacterium]|nr:hypothetical protein [Spirochaetales bacterium]
MKKKNAFSLQILLLLVALALAGNLVSCAENPGTTTMRLILSTEAADGSRTIMPQDSTLLDVTKYTVSGTGPNGKTFTRNSDSSSVEIEGLTIGEWTVTAKGLNREGTELVSGTMTFRLMATTTPQTIVLNTLIGTGSFSFALDWSLCDVADPNLEVYLTGPDMNTDEVPLDVTVNRETKVATVGESLSAGSYRIRVILKDGQQQVAGLVEALRISNGMTTSASHTFLFNELGPSSLMYFRDATGTPLRGNLSASGNPESFLDGLQYTYVFSFPEPEKVDTEGLSIDWYYDGNRIGETENLDRTGSSITLEAEYGVHRIDAVVFNKLLGSTGSAAYTYSVVPNGMVGEMALVNGSAGTSISNVDGQTLISPLPGGKFLVVTPNSARMSVCTVSSRALQVAKSYDAVNFHWLGSTTHVFSDEEMEFIVMTDNYGGTQNFTCLRFNPAANTIEPVAGMRFEGRVPAYGLPFTNFTAAAMDPVNGYIYLSDAGSLGLDYLLKVSGGTLTTGGTVAKKGSAYYNVSDMDTSPDGYQIVSTGLASTKFVSATINDVGSLVSMTESDAADSANTKIRFLNNQTVLAANSSGLTTYKVVSGGKYTKYKQVGISMNDIAADGAAFFYVADNSNRLVSFSVSGYEVTQLGCTTLDHPILRICLSGGHLAALLSDSTIALFEVIQ